MILTLLLLAVVNLIFVLFMGVIQYFLFKKTDAIEDYVLRLPDQFPEPQQFKCNIPPIDDKDRPSFTPAPPWNEAPEEPE